MAGDWIKIEKALPDKPEVWQIADLLKIDQDAVVGKLIRVFSWFDGHTESGNAPSVTEKMLDGNVRVTGFCEAMCVVGWMARDDASISLVNFSNHNGITGKKRAQGQKRQTVHRKNNAPSVTKASPEKRREEKRREEKKQNTARAAKLVPSTKRSKSTRDTTIAEDLVDDSWAPHHCEQ